MVEAMPAAGAIPSLFLFQACITTPSRSTMLSVAPTVTSLLTNHSNPEVTVSLTTTAFNRI